MGEAAAVVGGGAKAISSISSIASLGLDSGSSIVGSQMDAEASRMKGAGEKAGYEFRAKKAERAAEFGRMQAGLTDTHFRDELNTTLNNIDVIRAAGRIDAGSPTSAAIAERQTTRSDQQRLAAVGNLKQQAAEDDASASFLHQAGDFALAMGEFDADRKETMGYLDSGRKLTAGIGKMFG